MKKKTIIIILCIVLMLSFGYGYVKSEEAWNNLEVAAKYNQELLMAMEEAQMQSEIARSKAIEAVEAQAEALRLKAQLQECQSK